MATIKNPIAITSRGDVENAIKMSLKARSGDIGPSTFVKLTSDFSTETDTQLSSTANTGGVLVSVALDSDRAFVLHRQGAYLYAMVCALSSGTIVFGADTRLTTDSSSAVAVSAAVVDDNKVAITYVTSSTYVVVCTISDSVITMGSAVQVSAAKASSTQIVKASTNKALVITTSSSVCHGTVCNFSNRTVNKGQLVTLNMKIGKAVRLSENTIAAVASTANILTLATYDVSGNTISESTPTELCSTGGLQIVMAALGDGRVFITHAKQDGGVNDCNLYGIACSVSSSGTVSGENVWLAHTSNGNGSATSAVALDQNHVIVLYSEGANYCLNGQVCTVLGTTTIPGDDIRLSTSENSNYICSSPVALDLENVLVFHNIGASSSSYYAYCMPLTTVSHGITRATSIVNGLTKSICTSTSAGEVWVLCNRDS